ncbi:WD repeat-containing protein 1-B [Phytophthora cinnamomi]|uniref:WD repeat-containing protein 1-B n=1 Tax=Phytophthora cinnamomi TaxID=4785 RepID=UPI00355A1301|nr:WD repeat-containing protein 1-B [Phytophthora cinnamomi]
MELGAFADSSLCLEAIYSREERTEIIQKTLRILFITEYLVLVEYVVVMFPIAYSFHRLSLYHTSSQPNGPPRGQVKYGKTMIQPHCEHSPEWMMDTALHLYARCGRADASRMQLRHGADTEICNAQGFTPLLLAARFNQLEVLQLLLQHGARTNALAPLEIDMGHGVELGSCVHFAAESGHVQVLKFLVTAAALDADEYTRGRQGITPLHLAARLGRADVVRFLAARSDVDVNARDARGMTPLHHACDYQNVVSGETLDARMTGRHRCGVLCIEDTF